MTQIKVPPTIAWIGTSIGSILSYVKPANPDVGIVSMVVKNEATMATRDFQLPEERSKLNTMVARAGIFLDIDVLDRAWHNVLDDIIKDGRKVPIPEFYFE